MMTQMLKSTQNTIKKTIRCTSRRRISTLTPKSPNPERKVTIIGGGGGIGQPLSMFIKLNPLISSLSLFDLASVPGVAADIAHIPTRSQVAGFEKSEQLEEALDGSDLVIITAGFPKRRPNMSPEQLLYINASIVKHLSASVAKYCPKALVHIISNPLNSIVPVVVGVFKNAGTYDPKRLFGVTTLDVIRARTFYAEKAGVDPEDVTVPVIGGHAGTTTLPLFSQAVPQANLSNEDIDALTKRTQEGGTEVVTAKGDQGSATVSMAFGAALFADACLKGLNGVPNVVECAYVQSDVTEVPFFASKVRLGENGVEEVMGVGSLSDYENKALDNLIPELKQSIDLGIEHINKHPV